jgi:ribonuclease HII
MDPYQFDFDLISQISSPADDSFFSEHIPSFALDDNFTLAGVDEAGRGPLAGPVVAAAVILPSSPQIFGLGDSKMIPAEQREALYWEITETALATSVSVVDSSIIDNVNILVAAMQAMREAVKNLKIPPNFVVVDGNQRPGTGVRERAIVKGDQKSAAIMAASIVAKVTRDFLMKEMHEIYPHYGFDRHKGYACRTHLEAIRRYGPCPLHRMSFEPVRTLAQETLALFI